MGNAPIQNPLDCSCCLQQRQSKLNEHFSKPGKTVSIGDTVSIKENPIWRTFNVHSIPKSRVGAKLVQDNIQEITSAEDKAILDRTKALQSTTKEFWLGRSTHKKKTDEILRK